MALWAKSEAQQAASMRRSYEREVNGYNGPLDQNGRRPSDPKYAGPKSKK